MASEEGLRAGEPDRALELLEVYFQRIQKLERVFGHIHESAIEGDLCTYCGLDLRDQIHRRTPSPKEPR